MTTLDLTPEDGDERVGTTIDKRYRINGVLGRGGMGIVYQAEHVRLRRAVAIKLLHPAISGHPLISKRFEREAFAVARLNHPNCVAVTDSGELDDGTLYLVMELLEGESLAQRLDRDERLSVPTTLHIARHILCGLGHAHQCGIVHRDIKPANVMLVTHDSDPDFARILDFGIVKLIGDAAAEEGGEQLSHAGAAFGTPRYLSPEQAIGRRVDHRADLYAVGVIMFEMLAGQPPFESDDRLELLAMHTKSAVPAVVAAAPGVVVPAAVEAVIRRALEKKAADRFADAAAFIAAIDSISAGV